MLIDTRDHVVQFYDSDAELVATVGRYLAAAIRADEVVVVIATEAHRRAFARHVLADGFDLDGSGGGHVEWLDAAETMSGFITNGRVDEDAFDTVVGGLIRAAASTGRRIRAYGEMVRVLWDAGNVLAAVELEALWNDLGRRASFSLFCAYPSASVSGAEHAEALREVCHLHTGVFRTEERAFAARRDAPREARQFVIGTLQRWDCSDGLVADAALVLSELATNAVVHANSAFGVSLTIRDAAVRISVHDSSAALPTPRRARTTTHSGRGLRLVGRLATRWGVEPVADGKVVWAELSS